MTTNGELPSSIEEELDALEAVLAEDFKKIPIEDGSHIFEAHIFPRDDLSECHCSVHMRVTIPPSYPKQYPSIKVVSSAGLNRSHEQSLP